MKLVLCQLYPEHLSIYADRGNVFVLRQRCAWRGIELVERPLRPGEELDAGEIDLFLLGGGQDRDQLLIADDLQRHRSGIAGAIAAATSCSDTSIEAITATSCAGSGCSTSRRTRARRG
jgi:CobQ-like glutamine amidotransferase family enzyme